jgi:hypothetical protein
MARTTRIARLLLASRRVARTLYHGTTVDNEESIRQHGLVGQVGDFVKNAYGDYEVDLPDLVFAADKQGLVRSVSAMVHHIGAKLGKDFHSVTDIDILNHGLLVIMKEMEVGEYGLEHRPEGDENYRNQHPHHVEPGDYYAEELQADQFVKGRQLLRFLKRYDQWPRMFGPRSLAQEKQMRGLAITIALRGNPEKSKEEVMKRINEIPMHQLEKYLQRYRS